MITPPDPGPELLLALTFLSMLAKLWWYGRTRNPLSLTEAGVRFALFIFYALVTAATYSPDFHSVFTELLWRTYARWGFVALFLVEVVPWGILVIKKVLHRER